MNKLKPCPFCGGKAKQNINFRGRKNTWCSNAPISCVSGSVFTEDEWNTRAPQSAWISVDKEMPPIEIKPENGDRDSIYTHTDDVIVLCSNGDIHRSYHDGDVWCYHNLSGCPQWDVTHWRPLPEGPLK